MRVRDVMSTLVRTVTPNDRVAEVREIFRRFDIDQIVVAQHGTVLGIVADNDLRDAPDDAPVTEYMVREVTTIAPDALLRKAAGMMTGHAVGSLPVVEKGKLVGIVTTADLLNLLSHGSAHPAPNGVRPILTRREVRKRPASEATKLPSTRFRGPSTPRAARPRTSPRHR